MPLADYQTLVDKLVRDETGKVTTTDRDEAIARAVARYSQDRPREKTEDVVSPGGNYFDLPAGWQVDFSSLRSVEYPVGNIPLSLIAPERLGFYRTPTALQIMFADAIPAAANVRFNYTIRHQVDGSADTIRSDDREPVCAYAAAILLDQLASLFAGDNNPTIQADNVDHNSKGREYAARAATLRKRYFDTLGIDPKRQVAAGVVVNLDFPDSQGNDRLLHPKRHR
ncbi:MAG: hypothetical protein AB1560_13450 [Pseudomonadota bacterium]